MISLCSIARLSSSFHRSSRSQRLARVSFPLSALALAALNAQAVVIRVPEDQPTLPSALVAAIAGDTISIANGTYDFSTSVVVSVPAVVITGRTLGGAYLRKVSGISPVLDIRADDVVVQSLKLSGAGLFCVQMAATAHNTLIRLNLFDGTSWSVGVDDRGVGSRIERNTFQGCYSSVQLVGSSGTFAHNNVIQCGPAWVTRGALIEENSFTRCFGTSDFSSSEGGGVIVDATSELVTLRSNRFEECRVDGGWQPAGKGGAIFASGPTNLHIERNEFVHNQAGSGAAIYAENAHVTIEDNHFIANQDSLLTNDDNEVHGKGAGAYLSASTAVVTGNTFHRNRSDLGGGAIYATGASNLTISRNLMTENASDVAGGILIQALTGPRHFDCNDAWANEVANYAGFTDPTGTNGNISLDPHYCDPDLGADIRSSSPCAPEHSPAGCGLIGAFGVGCFTAAVETVAMTGTRIDVHPNPAREHVSISMVGSNPIREGRITIHDVTGRTVREWTWSDATTGVSWDGRDRHGRPVPSGIYLIDGVIDSAPVAEARVLWIPR